jgi:hypothetical protein
MMEAVEMLRDPSLKAWNRIVSERFRNLSLSQVTGLSVWSFGIALTRSSSLNRVAEMIGGVNGERPNTVRIFTTSGSPHVLVKICQNGDKSHRKDSGTLNPTAS